MKQIIAMGGGGFSMEPDNLALDQYISQQTGKDRPKVCFVPTASGDAELYVKNFYVAFVQLDAKPSFLSLFRPPPDLEAFVMEKDIIYVGGGNTRNLMVLWREWGLDIILKKAYENGTILAGVSAGAICWFEQGVTDSTGDLAAMDCLGFLPGSCNPHYDGEENRRPVYHRLLAEDAIKPGYAAEDSAALHFIDGKLHQVVSSVETATAYRVKKVAGEVVETRLDNVYLKDQ
jgi:dipeptidase E